MKRYSFDEKGRFVIEDYNNSRPFASFLPGIAGEMGIPMWAFYVNRGQGLASYGIQDKNNPIMEFQPANKSYQGVFYSGFRTFIKVLEGNKAGHYEPFSVASARMGAKQTMITNEHGFEIEEVCEAVGLKTKVSYFMVPNEAYAALVRKVAIENISGKEMRFEVIDGQPVLLPYGVTNDNMKNISQTLAAFMEVTNMEEGIPFYKLRMSAADSSEVEILKAGHFYLVFDCKDGKTELLRPIVDPAMVFGSNTSLGEPDEFLNGSIADIYGKKQTTFNKIPCGMAGKEYSLAKGSEVELYSVFGHVSDIGFVNKNANIIANKAYMVEKQKQAVELIEGLTQGIYTKTSSEMFDAYARQTYLDNILRGGYPLTFGDGENPAVYHVFSRKHGDLERDYNFFSLLPEFYSQGNGNYRDVNQNRRCDILFNPKVGDFNVQMFMSLIQADGFNPLVVQGIKFKLKEGQKEAVQALVEDGEKIANLFDKPFTPGSIAKYIFEKGVALKVSQKEFLNEVIKNSEHIFDADFGEGYWVDHWTYNLDLVETYLAVYPDRMQQMMFEKPVYTYYESPAVVAPRDDKYVLSRGKVRQYGALIESKEKEELIHSRAEYKHVVRANHGKGEIYKSTLFSKFICLAANKLVTFDPFGMGIEMESEKPGWYDALNGLPGLFGSSMSETFELKRLLAFMNAAVESREDFKVEIPVELYDLLAKAEKQLDEYFASDDANKDFTYWDNVAYAREAYRRSIMFGFEGSNKTLTLGEIKASFEKFVKKINIGIDRALEAGKGIYPTYFYYEVDSYDIIKDSNGTAKVNKNGLPCVRAKSFKPVNIPYFQEGVVRALKVQDSVEAARSLYNKVKETGLYDSKLKMYKVNDSLDGVSFELGRTKAFVPGWLENESIWLHMEYKYILEVLKCGLYEEFFEDFKNVLIPFMDPEVYGRSTLENSSFLVSSANPDESLHGAGFVARLSGSTAEFLSIWSIMMAGEKPFTMKGGELCLELKPALPGWMFDDEGKVEFMFLGGCKVTYHNPSKVDTFAKNFTISKMIVTMENGEEVEIKGNVIGAPYSSQIREGKARNIEVFVG